MTLGAVHASRQGAAHLKDGTPNQDSVVVAMPSLGATGVDGGHGGQRRGGVGQIFPTRFPCCLYRRRGQPDPPAQSQPRHSRKGAPDAQRSAARCT